MHKQKAPKKRQDDDSDDDFQVTEAKVKEFLRTRTSQPSYEEDMKKKERMTEEFFSRKLGKAHDGHAHDGQHPHDGHASSEAHHFEASAFAGDCPTDARDL